MDGVEGIVVDYGAKTATVTCSSGGCDTDAMVAALEAAGYGAKVAGH